MNRPLTVALIVMAVAIAIAIQRIANAIRAKQSPRGRRNAPVFHSYYSFIFMKNDRDDRPFIGLTWVGELDSDSLFC